MAYDGINDAWAATQGRGLAVKVPKSIAGAVSGGSDGPKALSPDLVPAMSSQILDLVVYTTTGKLTW